MEGLVFSTFIGLLFGTLGTTLGGVLGVSFKATSNRLLSFILEFAAGLMVAIVCFELIPEAMEIAGITQVIMGILAGVVTMIVCNDIIKRKFSSGNGVKYNSILRTGIIVGIGLAIHNLPEGLAIGSGFDVSSKLGFSLAIAVALHDVPEGIAIAAPLKKGGMEVSKIIIYTLLAGMTTGVGAFIGVLIGNISPVLIGLCLAFAAGAMLYIVSGELIPESNKIYRGRFSSMGNILGFILGVISMQI